MAFRRTGAPAGAGALCLTAALLAAGGCATTVGRAPSSPPSPPVPASGPVEIPAHRSSRDFTIVIPGGEDTLESLADRFLGDAGKDWIIARYNGVPEARTGRPLVIPRGPFDRGGLKSDRYQTVPVLSYHKFSRSPGDADAMTVTEAAFEAQMKFLAEEGYRAITLDEFYDFLDFKADLPEKSVVITFDDGWRSMYEIAYPVLRRHGFPAALFVSTEMITGSRTTLSWEMVREMMAGGIAVESHTVDHRNLEKMKEGESVEDYLADMERELARSAQIIREKTGRAPRYLAYPYGTTNALTIALAADLGYRGALTVKRGSNPFFIDNYRVNRSMIFGEYDLPRFEKNLSVSSGKALR